MTTTKLSSKGQVVIPKAIRDAMGWKPSADLIVERRGGEVVLREAAPEKIYTIAQLKGILNYDGPPKTIKDMNEGIEAALRERWSRKLGRKLT